LIYIQVPSNSNRLNYVFDLIFNQLLGVKYQVVKDEEFCHIRYAAAESSLDCIQIPIKSDLLFTSSLEPISVSHKNKGKDTRLFPLENPYSKFWDFDIFSAVFYLASRYEEYGGFTPDAHQRFPPEASILHKTESFEYPLINLWVKELKEALLLKWPDLNFKEPEFQYISTIDVDSTFRYKNKGFLWTTSGLLKDLVKGNFKETKERISTILNWRRDAFDVFEKLFDLHKKHRTKVIYFFLLGDYAPFDKNIHWKNQAQAKVIKKISNQTQTGIHPSYLSNSKSGQLEKEVNRFDAITGKKPILSRQHFLIHSFPKTYQMLLKQGILEDYTLGFTSQYGFRAGIASPFYFYDLEKDQSTDLLLYPFCSMDITPLHYYKLNPEQAIEKNLELLNRVKAVNGVFISLWHNESLSGTGRWEGGWTKVYEQLLKDAETLTDKK
jgi:hypothetical protein